MDTITISQPVFPPHSHIFTNPKSKMLPDQISGQSTITTLGKPSIKISGQTWDIVPTGWEGAWPFSCVPTLKTTLGQSLWCQNHLFVRFLLLNKLNRTALKLRSSSISFFLRSSSIFFLKSSF